MSQLQHGKLEHRNTKIQYTHTNKQCYIDQMVNRDALENAHKRMNNEIVAATAALTSGFKNLDKGLPSLLPCPLLSILM